MRCGWVFELREWVGDCTIEGGVYGIEALNSSVHSERCYSSYLPHPLQLEYTSYSIRVLSLPLLLRISYRHNGYPLHHLQQRPVPMARNFHQRGFHCYLRYNRYCGIGV